MATPTKYTKSISVDFPGPVILSVLKKEIQDHSDIYHAVDFLAVSGDVVEIWFKDAIDAVEVVALNAVIAAHAGVKTEIIPRVEIANHVKAEAVPTQGSRYNAITHNFCDKTSWYSDAVRVVDEILTVDGGDPKIYHAVHKPIVRATRGKIFGEHDLLDDQGNSYAVSLTDNGVTKTEKDKHSGAGDYEIDYVNGTVTFDVAPTGPVVMTYHKVQSSRFTIKPAAGKKITIGDVETQFSSNYDITDTIVFQPRALVELAAPHLAVSNGGPIPDGTLIDVASPTMYNTEADFLRESNGAFPTVSKSTNPNAASNWRMNAHDTQGYPWRYKAGIILEASKGAQIDIYLEHDEEFGGDEATATLYCLSEDE